MYLMYIQTEEVVWCVETLSLTVVQSVDRAGAREGPQELGQDVHGELLEGHLPQQDHGQRDGRVHVGACRDGRG